MVSKVFRDQHELGLKAWILGSTPRYEQCARVKRNWCVVAGRVMGSAVSCTSSSHQPLPGTAPPVAPWTPARADALQREQRYISHSVTHYTGRDGNVRTQVSMGCAVPSAAIVCQLLVRVRTAPAALGQQMKLSGANCPNMSPAAALQHDLQSRG